MRSPVQGGTKAHQSATSVPTAAIDVWSTSTSWHSVFIDVGGALAKSATAPMAHYACPTTIYLPHPQTRRRRQVDRDRNPPSNSTPIPTNATEEVDPLCTIRVPDARCNPSLDGSRLYEPGAPRQSAKHPTFLWKYQGWLEGGWDSISRHRYCAELQLGTILTRIPAWRAGTYLAGYACFFRPLDDRLSTVYFCQPEALGRVNVRLPNEYGFYV